MASNYLDPELSDLWEIEATANSHDHFDKAFGMDSNVEDRAHKEHHWRGLQRPNQAAGGNVHTQKDNFLCIKVIPCDFWLHQHNKFASEIPIFLAAISFHAHILWGADPVKSSHLPRQPTSQNRRGNAGGKHIPRKASGRGKHLESVRRHSSVLVVECGHEDQTENVVCMELLSFKEVQLSQMSQLL